MATFSDAERDFLVTQRLLGRLATVDGDGNPHVTPVGWSFDAEQGTVEITGRDFAATKKFRDVQRTGRAAIVIDDVLPPWHPRGIELRGRANTLLDPAPAIRIHIDRVISWGLA